MKYNIKDDFLEAFKTLEDVLASNGFTRQSTGKGLVAQFEDTLDAESDVRKGLQQCRIIRNGYQHENRTLFLPTPDAVKLLRDTAKKLDNRKFAKHMAKKSKKILETDKPTEALGTNDIKFITEGGVIPILSTKGEYIGGIDEHTLVHILSYGKKVQLKSMLSDKTIEAYAQNAAKVTAPDVLYSELSDQDAYVVIDEKGQYKGMIQKTTIKR